MIVGTIGSLIKISVCLLQVTFIIQNEKDQLDNFITDSTLRKAVESQFKYI